MLLDRGANPSVTCTSYFGEMTPLTYAAVAGDSSVFRMLVERGASLKGSLFLPLAFAVRANCNECVDLLRGSASKDDLSIALTIIAHDFCDENRIRMLVDGGADVNAKDREGRTPLMLAASSDTIPLDAIKLLLARGADVNARTPKGESALDFAQTRGSTAVTALLIKSGAKESSLKNTTLPTPRPANSVHAALNRSIPSAPARGYDLHAKVGLRLVSQQQSYCYVDRDSPQGRGRLRPADSAKATDGDCELSRESGAIACCKAVEYRETPTL